MYTEMQIFIHMSHSKKILNVGNYVKDTPKEDKPLNKGQANSTLAYTLYRKSPLKEDNLSTKDKMAGPESVLIKRFHCSWLLSTALYFNVKNCYGQCKRNKVFQGFHEYGLYHEILEIYTGKSLENFQLFTISCTYYFESQCQRHIAPFTDRIFLTVLSSRTLVTHHVHIYSHQDREAGTPLCESDARQLSSSPDRQHQAAVTKAMKQLHKEYGCIVVSIVVVCYCCLPQAPQVRKWWYQVGQRDLYF